MAILGVDPPEIALSHAESMIGIEVYDQLDSEIIIECSIPETAYDSEDAQFMLRWLHGENEVPLLGNVRQLLSPSMVTVTLTISVFEESANGLYTCEAVNSNAAYSSSITLIGTATYDIQGSPYCIYRSSWLNITTILN